MSLDNSVNTPPPDNLITGVIKTKGLMYEWEFVNRKIILSESPVFYFPLKQADIINVIVCQLVLTQNMFFTTKLSLIKCKLKLISCGGVESVIIRYTLSYPEIEGETEEITCSSNTVLGGGIMFMTESNVATVKCYIEIGGFNPKKTKPGAEVDFGLGRDLTNALTRPQFSDCTLCIGDKELKAHKVILAARSPVFETMFCQDMKESKTGKVVIVDLEFVVIEEMINFIYTGTSPRIKTMAGKLLEAADKYMIDGLATLCGVTLAEDLSVENAVSTLILADRYSAQDLEMAAVRFIINNLGDVKKTNEWPPLCGERKDLFAELFYRMDEVTMNPCLSV